MVTDESKRIPWCFPCYFFMFLAFFISVKFVFIFFFETSFEPEFMFNLTPFYLLSGLEKLQLLFISLVFLIFEAYLHFHSTRKNLIYSFVFTIALLTGTGIVITSRNIVFDNIYYYIIFFCLIVVLLIDHKHILSYSYNEEEFYEDYDKDFTALKKPDIFFSPKNFLPDKKSSYAKTSEIEKQPIFSSSSSREDLKKVSDIFGKLEEKEDKIKNLEQELEYRRRVLVNDEKHLSDNLSDLTGLKSLSPSFFKTKEVVDEFDKDFKSNTKVDFFEDINESAFLVRKGKIEKINDSFSELLGYEDVDIVGKNFLNLIIPSDYSKLQKYFLKRLNGKNVSFYEATFRSKDNKKVRLHVDLKPTNLNGKTAHIAIVKKIDEIKE
jgi:PAS domain S-box-containing protein